LPCVFRSAGIGRTGTFIGLDTIVDNLTARKAAVAAAAGACVVLFVSAKPARLLVPLASRCFVRRAHVVRFSVGC
jgi:hypothetical protein